MKINILISTIDEGIEKVEDVVLEPREDVSYIISHQYTDEKFLTVPESLDRDDIKVSHIKGAGVTRSRNNAIQLAEGDVGLFSDDDVKYKDSDIDTLKKIFVNHQQVDIGIFKIRTPPGEPEYKSYPEEIKEYEVAPTVGTVQLAFRVDAVQKKNISFDERFGAGEDLLIGNEEKIFLHDCLSSGLRVCFFPEYIVEHPYESTSKSIPKFDRRKNWVVGGVDCRINGQIALIKAFLGTIKILPDLLRSRVNPIRYLYQRLSAVIYVLRTNKKRR